MLFVPADRPDRIHKAAAAGPDAIIVDLEDAVTRSRLDEARTGIVAALRALVDGASSDETPRRAVRVHPATDEALGEDVAAIVSPHLDAVMLPKAEGVDDIAILEEALAGAERTNGVPLGHTGIIPLIESCHGLRAAHDIAIVSPRVVAMAFSSGEAGDFMADLGGRWTQDGRALHHARSRFLYEVRAAGVAAAVDGVCMHLDDESVLLSECAIGATLGYDGKLAIHPRQLAAIHAAFTPDEAAVAAAHRLLDAFTAAQEAGEGVIRHEGRMVDTANARVARRVLLQASLRDVP